MIIEWLIKRFSKENLEDELIVGLFVGLFMGLFVGLIGGLIGGLGYFLAFFIFLGLTSLILHFPNFIPLGLFILLGIILIEFFFWFDTQKPKKKQDKFWFTCLKKGEAILEAVAILGYLNLARLTIEKIIRFRSWDIILKWVGYIGAGLIGLGILASLIWLYVKLNSLKYEDSKNKK